MFKNKYIILKRKLVSDSLVLELLWILSIFKSLWTNYRYILRSFLKKNDSILQMASIATASSKVLERNSFNDTYEQNSLDERKNVSYLWYWDCIKLNSSLILSTDSKMLTLNPEGTGAPLTLLPDVLDD